MCNVLKILNYIKDELRWYFTSERSFLIDKFCTVTPATSVPTSLVRMSGSIAGHSLQSLNVKILEFKIQNENKNSSGFQALSLPLVLVCDLWFCCCMLQLSGLDLGTSPSHPEETKIIFKNNDDVKTGPKIRCCTFHNHVTLFQINHLISRSNNSI